MCQLCIKIVSLLATSTSCGSRSREAEHALAHDDVPVGAVIVHAGEVIGAGHNERELREDPTRPRRDDRHPRGGSRARLLAAARHGALRHARAVRDVRGRDRPRPHPARRLRHDRPEGGRRRLGPRRARRAPPQPPARRLGRRAGGRMRRALAGLLRVPGGRQIATLPGSPRRGARVVESGGLENRCVGNPCTEGSNPSPSAHGRERPVRGQADQRNRRPARRAGRRSATAMPNR